MDDPFQETLNKLAQDNLMRTLRTVGPGPRFLWEGRDIVNLASNDYLGLTAHPSVKAAAHDAIDRYGTGSGASRLITGSFSVHAELERALAQWQGTAAALVFSSGYAANVGTITALVGPEDEVFSDALNHASIIDGVKLSRAAVRIYRHRDWRHLKDLLSNPSRGRRLIVTDGVFSMDGDIAPLKELVELADEADALLMVDDAHGAGTLGDQGQGAAHWLGVAHRVPVHIGTLSKALGAQGGFVAGSRSLIDLIVNRARSFVFSTGLAPASAAAALRALTILRSEPERRQRPLIWAQRFARAMPKASVPSHVLTPIVPIVVGDAGKALEISRQLLAAGIFAPAIRPPTVPVGTSRIRISFTAAHTKEDVDRAIEAFLHVLGKEVAYHGPGI